MAKAERKERVVELGKSFEGLKKRVEDANIELAKISPAETVGRLGPSKLRSPDEDRKVREATKALIADIQEHVAVLGEVLADRESFEWQCAEVAAEETDLARCVASVKGEKGINEVLREYMFAMVRCFPRTSIGENHLADQGLRIGFFQHSSGRGEFSLELLLTDPRTGQWKRTKLSSNVPLAIRVMQLLLPFDAEVRKAHDDEVADRKRRLVTLRDGTAPLLDVLTSGSGEAFCHSPEQKDRHIAEANLRLYVQDGLITAIGAVGGKLAESLEGVSITIDCLRFSRRIDDAETADALRKKIALRRFIEEGIDYAKGQKALAESAITVAAARQRIANAKQKVRKDAGASANIPVTTGEPTPAPAAEVVPTPTETKSAAE
jgi:hypothetical protein